MGHHHHEDHHDNIPKLPKTVGQLLFVIIVAMLAGASFFVYKKLIPMADWVSQQNDSRRVRKVCEGDAEKLASLSADQCSCLADAISKSMDQDIKSWLKESSVEERGGKYLHYAEVCREVADADK